MDNYLIGNILLWLHLIALAGGGVASFGIPVVGRNLPTATAETRPMLFKIVHGLSTIGRASIGVLLVTGPLMLWLKYGWAIPNFWFWIKMILLLIMLAAVIYAGILIKRAEGGDREAGQMTPRVGMVAMIAFIGIIFSAVFAFN